MESRKRKQRQQVRQQQWRRRFTWVTGEDGMGSREKVVEKHGWSATVAGRRGTEVAEGRKGIGGLAAVKKGLATTEATGRGPTRAAVAGEQRGLARKRGRKLRRARLEQRPRRGMAGWKRLRLQESSGVRPVATVAGRHGRKAALEEKGRWWPTTGAGEEEGGRSPSVTF
ncbi:hypothetical protein B296_00016047 [Ensete ventricosum]|uniref:Uncharacterized protein n=1 Tax=Ensete ventricosum TaxID=4639 RepID=A0A427AA00_ENSVE|nr:hypothetical protein B296_00016047 [Ensete ventricosum]